MNTVQQNRMVGSKLSSEARVIDDDAPSKANLPQVVRAFHPSPSNLTKQL